MKKLIKTGVGFSTSTTETGNSYSVLYNFR